MANLKSVFPNFPSRDSVIAYLQTTPKLWDCFSKLPEDMREMLIGYFLGKNGLPVSTAIRIIPTNRQDCPCPQTRGHHADRTGQLRHHGCAGTAGQRGVCQYRNAENRLQISY